MKRYAYHRLYTNPEHYIVRAVVTLDEEGNVVHYAPLQGEIHSTEWLGGIIVLSDNNVAPLDDFFSWLKKYAKTEHKKLYAWHWSNFDFEKGQATSQSILCRL